MDAVTASLIWPRRDGSDESRCWNNGVVDNEVGGMLSISSKDCKEIYSMLQKRTVPMQDGKYGPSAHSSTSPP